MKYKCKDIESVIYFIEVTPLTLGRAKGVNKVSNLTVHMQEGILPVLSISSTPYSYIHVNV